MESLIAKYKQRMAAAVIPVDVPNATDGDWEVSDVVVTEDEAHWQNLRCAVKGEVEYMVNPGTYKRLRRGGTVVMSNTPFEVLTNQPIIQAATGRVLINGLGIGMVLNAILAKPEVKEVWVVEASMEVIRLVAPVYGVRLDNTTQSRGTTHYASPDGRLVIAHADAFKYLPPLHMEWDAVWHDIWDTVCGDNLKEMRRLAKKYAGTAKWQGSWCENICRRYARGR